MKARIDIDCTTTKEFDDLRFQSRNITKEQALIVYDHECEDIHIVVFDVLNLFVEAGCFTKAIHIGDNDLYPTEDSYVTVEFTED